MVTDLEDKAKTVTIYREADGVTYWIEEKEVASLAPTLPPDESVTISLIRLDDAQQAIKKQREWRKATQVHLEKNTILLEKLKARLTSLPEVVDKIAEQMETKINLEKSCSKALFHILVDYLKDEIRKTIEEKGL